MILKKIHQRFIRWWNYVPDSFEETMRLSRHYIIISMVLSAINLCIIAGELCIIVQRLKALFQ